MMRIALASYLTAALLVCGYAAAGTAPFAFKTNHCVPQSSCIGMLPVQSTALAPISVKPGAEPPAVCISLAMGILMREDAILCEAFIASGKGTPRQRATALVNLGHWQTAMLPQEIINPVKSFESWDRAIAEDPAFAEPHVAKAGSAALRERHEEAISNYDRALALAPRHWRAMFGKASVLMARGQIAEAIALGREAVDAAPGVSIAYQYHASLLMASDDLEGAATAYRKAGETYQGERRRVPGLMQTPSPWSELARLEIRLGHLDRALSAADRVIGQQGENTADAFDFLLRAEINERSGRAADAANDYEKAVSMLDPGYERIDDFRARIAMLRASVGNSAAGTAFRDLLRSGKLQSILRVQVFLNNRGFDDVTIDGKPSAALEKALERCLSNSECRESMGRSI